MVLIFLFVSVFWVGWRCMVRVMDLFFVFNDVFLNILKMDMVVISFFFVFCIVDRIFVVFIFLFIIKVKLCFSGKRFGRFVVGFVFVVFVCGFGMLFKNILNLMIGFEIFNLFKIFGWIFLNIFSMFFGLNCSVFCCLGWN